MKPITIAQQIEELERELGVRERVFPQWIKPNGLMPPKISKETADHRIECLKATIKLLKSLIPQQGEIFKHG